jgi:protein-arginine kinase activator protein McsA
MVKRLTQEEYVEKATKLHEGRYTYENTVYTRSAAKIEVTCPNHGAFLVTANNHVSASNLTGCPECYGNKKIPLEAFITKATVIHNGKYSYEKVDLVNSQKHIEIICPEHGSFMQTPTRHISGRGCQICGGTTRQSKQSLIDKAVNIYGDTFDYVKLSIINLSVTD